MRKVKEKRTDLVTLGVFSALIIVLSMFEWNYVEVNDNMYMDLSVIPAVIAFLIGGPYVGAGVAFVWALSGFSTGPIPPDSLFMPTLIIKMTFAFVTWKSYRIASKWWPGSPDCMYVGLVMGQAVRWAMTLATFSVIRETNYFLNHWLYIWMVVETMLCVIALHLFVKNLRKVHISTN